MVALGTTVSAFWIMVNNSWMQVPTGFVMEGNHFVPTDWGEILFNTTSLVRIPHMILAAYLTTAFVVGGVGSWYFARGPGQG